jgi:hypothetical protein
MYIFNFQVIQTVCTFFCILLQTDGKMPSWWGLIMPPKQICVASLAES